MIEVNFAMKSIIFIWTVLHLVKSDASDLPFKPRELREDHKETNGNHEPHLKSSYCPIRSRFQAISNSSFKCKAQDFDANNGISYKISLSLMIIVNIYSYFLMTSIHQCFL